jgi:hypothetical protein
MVEEKAQPAGSAAVVKDAAGKDAAGKGETGKGEAGKGETDGKAKGAKGDSAAKGGSSKGKKGSGKKGDRAGGGGSDGGEGTGLTLADHPRAAHSVARTKAWGGLAGFALGGYLSLSSHTLADAGLRALAAGLVCYVVAWAIAVFLWRRLVVAELSHARQELVAAEIAKLTSTAGGAASSTGAS